MPRTGEIGEQIFDQVEKLVASGMNRSQAFAKISEDTGRRAGTVAANYYRVARKRAGGSLRPRRSSTAKRARSTATTARRGGRRAATRASGDIDRIANDLVANVQALTEAVKSQAAEVADLRERLDGVRKAVGR